MNKPDWNDAPEWANYLAMDDDGAWYWYEHEPLPVSFHKEWRFNRGKTILAAKLDQVWIDSLETRPE